MKIKKILRIAFFSGLAAVLLSFTAQAECAEYGSFPHPEDWLKMFPILSVHLAAVRPR